jgi:hypothetical protein
VTSVYFSNDIDGTDEAHADATGTPEPEGLEPEFVVELIRRLGRDIGMLGGDVMEVAPPVKRRPDSTERTVSLAVRYFRETVAAILRDDSLRPLPCATGGVVASVVVLASGRASGRGPGEARQVATEARRSGHYTATPDSCAIACRAAARPSARGAATKTH